ncbi:MAG: S24 family peptidase [Betaproteobacteria bacterium]|jgi:SOS-response transcriptional repressor LexA|nr:S24 family peptidase [Betaproteobacteria bacterium]
MTMTTQRRIIPVMPAPTTDAADAAQTACENAEPYALMVLGDSMLPEFAEGEIIVVEPEGLARDGSYVVAQHDGELIFRQLLLRDGRWRLHPLNSNYADAEIAGIEAVRGVVIQKSRPGSRRSRKSYVD